VNRTPPDARLIEGDGLSAQQLAIIGTLARTYEAQRLRLLERIDPSKVALPSPLRPLDALEPDVWLDGAMVSASIVDTVAAGHELLAAQAVVPPLSLGPVEVMTAEAGWWDALFGDVERRSALPPRSISVSLPADVPPAVRAVFADRVTT
jgi:hypothetical protein